MRGVVGRQEVVDFKRQLHGRQTALRDGRVEAAVLFAFLTIVSTC